MMGPGAEQTAGVSPAAQLKAVRLPQGQIQVKFVVLYLLLFLLAFVAAAYVWHSRGRIDSNYELDSSESTVIKRQMTSIFVVILLVIPFSLTPMISEGFRTAYSGFLATLLSVPIVYIGLSSVLHRISLAPSGPMRGKLAILDGLLTLLIGLAGLGVALYFMLSM